MECQCSNGRFFISSTDLSLVRCSAHKSKFGSWVLETVKRTKDVFSFLSCCYCSCCSRESLCFCVGISAKSNLIKGCQVRSRWASQDARRSESVGRCSASHTWSERWLMIFNHFQAHWSLFSSIPFLLIFFNFVYIFIFELKFFFFQTNECRSQRHLGPVLWTTQNHQGWCDRREAHWFQGQIHEYGCSTRASSCE